MVIEMSRTYQIMQLNIILTLEKSLAALTIRSIAFFSMITQKNE